MAGQPYIQTHAVTEALAPLAAGRTVITCTISCPPDNGENVIFCDPSGNEVPWVPGEWHEFVDIDISQIRVKGSTDDAVTIIGHD